MRTSAVDNVSSLVLNGSYTHRYIGNCLRGAHEVRVARDVDVGATAGRSRPGHLGHQVGIELVQPGNHLSQPFKKVAPRVRRGAETVEGLPIAAEGVGGRVGGRWGERKF